jgi:hypothetical protein
MFSFLGLLAIRIRTISRGMPCDKTCVVRNRIFPIMNIIVDAGILYSALLLTTIVMLALKSNVTFAMADIVSGIRIFIALGRCIERRLF